MFRIKFEVEEQEETPLPIESENDRIKRLLSLKFFGNNSNNVGGSTTSDTNNGNVSGTLKHLQQSPEKNGMMPKKVVPMKKQKNLKPKQLDNSTTNSVAFVSKSIKTEPVESSLSLTTQLNNSLNIQSLLRQNRIQNGWTTNEQSIPIGTQQKQSLLSTTIESIVLRSTENQKVPFLYQSSSILNPNLNTNGTQQQQQSLLVPKIEPIVSENHQEVPLSLDQSFLIPNGTQQQQQSLLVPKIEHLDWETNTDQHSGSGSLISDLDSSLSASTFSTTEVAVGAAPAPPEAAAVPLLVGKKPLPLGIPPLTLEERKERKMERDRLSYHRQKANPKQSVNPEIMAEKRRRIKEYNQKYRQHWLANATPEQLEQIRLKHSERGRRHLEKESEEQRQRRLERMKQYDRTVRKQRWQTMTPEERENKRAIKREYECRYRKKRMMEKKKMESQTSKSLTNLVIDNSESSNSTLNHLNRSSDE